MSEKDISEAMKGQKIIGYSGSKDGLYINLDDGKVLKIQSRPEVYIEKCVIKIEPKICVEVIIRE